MTIKQTIRKYKIVEKHRKLVKKGNYLAARNLLRLLRDGYVRLGLGDADFESEEFLESIGCPVHYGRGFYGATFHI